MVVSEVRGRPTPEKVCAKSSSGLESASHEADHGESDHRLGTLDEIFVVLAEAPTLAEPGEGALDRPAFRQDDEAAQVVRALDNLQIPAGTLTDPADELAGVATVPPELLEAWQLPGQ